MRIGSLCSGIEGFGLGLERASVGTVIWHSEIDRDASRVLAERWPGVPNHGDLKTAAWERVEPCDLLIAGYPCQPFSSAGQRRGTDDERHLWPHVLNALRVLRPPLALFENVAGHVSLGLDVVLADLAAVGFDAWWGTVRASDVGAPHRRERVFILATDTDQSGLQGAQPAGRRLLLAGGGGAAAFTPSEQMGASGQPREGARVSASDTNSQSLRVRPGGVGGQTGAREGEGQERQRIRADVGDGRPDPSTDADCGRLEVSSKPHGEPTGGQSSSRRHDPDGCSEALTDASDLGCQRQGEPRRRRRRPEDGGGQAPADTTGEGRSPRGPGEAVCEPGELERLGRCGGVADFGQFGPAIARWERVLGRRAPDPVDERGRLSAMFTEWMMGFPEGHVTALLGRTAALRCLGNAVVPQVASWVGLQLLTVQEAA